MEALSRNGVPDHFVIRYRLDDEFARRITSAAIAEYLGNPGPRFEIEVDRSKSRDNLLSLLSDSIVILKREIIEILEPRLIFPDPAATIEKMEFFLVSLHKWVTKNEAKAILSDKNLESVGIEEALTWALNTQSWPRGNRSVVALTADESDDIEFSTIVSQRAANLCAQKSFSPSVEFLVKRKKP